MISGAFISVHKTCQENDFHASTKRLQAMKNKWKRKQAIFFFFTVMLNKGGKGKVINSTEAKYFGTILDMGKTC